MTFREPNLASDVALCCKIHYANVNQATEMATIVAALGSDTTTHDSTIEARSAALTVGPAQTRFQNDILLLVNQAKAGNLSNSQIISALDDALGVIHAPGVIDVPFASAAPYPPPTTSTICSVTNGNWTGAPTSYTYQWKRDGVTNIGVTNSPTAPYTLIAADIGGHSITCVVTAINATGSQAAPPSNAILT